MNESAGFWVKAGTVVTGGIGLVVGTFRGIFVTRGECRLKSETCLSGIRKEISEMKNELAAGNKKFENTERYLVAMAAKMDIKPGDIAKI